MKYSAQNEPFKCMLTNNPCYKAKKTMTVKGVLWHSTGANNPNVKRYVQPMISEPDYKEITARIGVNANHNDWNHTTRQVGVNAFIGKDAKGEVLTVQTMPWGQKPWGCASGSKGSCNDGWIQFEICEDGLTNKTYFDAIYKEACELTAYLCKMYNLDPKGTVTKNGVKVPVILCHADSHKLGFGNNHADVLHWFKKHNKTMDDVRNDVANLLKTSAEPTPAPAPAPVTPTPVPTPTPTPAPTQTSTLMGSTNEEKIWNYLMSRINNPYGVAGIMGNIKTESSYNPKNLQNSYEKSLGFTDDTYTTAVDNGSYSKESFINDKAGYGLVQWTYWSLKQGLYEAAKTKKVSIGDLYFQIEYLCDLLSKSYKTVWNTALNAKTVAEASNDMMLKFERPANQTVENQQKRASIGQTIFDKYAKVNTTAPTAAETVAPVAVADIVFTSGNSKRTVRICHAAWDENEKAKGGAAGDQTGAEVCTRSWYSRPWSAVLRYPDATIGQKAAAIAEKLANSPLVGYDQGQRNTLYTELAKNNWDVDKYLASGIKTEVDCASFVYACYCVLIPAMRSTANAPVTSNMITKYKNWGFTSFTTSDYTTANDKLILGDLLVKSDAHTAMVSSITGGAPTVKNDVYKGKGVGVAVAKSGMNIRNGAGTSYSSYGIIPTGTKIEVLEVLASGWYKIVYTGCAAGYAYTSNENNKYYTYTPWTITTPITTTTFTPYVVIVTGTPLNIRKGPGTNYTIVGSIKTQSSYTIVEQQGNFGKLKSGAGWICLDYTKKK